MALSAMTMKRIEACAWIVASDKAEKIEAIAEATGNNTLDSAKMYIIGALKAGIRRGTYRTYSDALDALEREQIGDRGESIGGLSAIERDVRRINHINAKPSTQWDIELMGSKEVTEKKSHKRNMAKVYGSLYVQWETKEKESTVDYVYENAERETAILHMDSTIRAYIHEYIGRLSPTAQKAVKAIVEARYSADAIATAKPDTEVYALRNKLNYLHKGFPKREAITAREFGELLQKYAV